MISQAKNGAKAKEIVKNSCFPKELLIRKISEEFKKQPEVVKVV